MKFQHQDSYKNRLFYPGFYCMVMKTMMVLSVGAKVCNKVKPTACNGLEED